jgi:hypothetical protein
VVCESGLVQLEGLITVAVTEPSDPELVRALLQKLALGHEIEERSPCDQLAGAMVVGEASTTEASSTWGTPEIAESSTVAVSTRTVANFCT